MNLNDFVNGLRIVNTASRRLRSALLNSNFAVPQSVWFNLEKAESDFLKEYVKNTRINDTVNINPHPYTPYENLDKSLTWDEVDAGRQQGKIQAIKKYRQRTNSGLADAKRVVEDYFSNNGYQFYLPK